MGWLTSDARPPWKRSWSSRTLSSLQAPPLPLLAVLAIVVFYFLLSAYFSVKEEVEKNVVVFRLFMFLLPVVLVFLVRGMAEDGRLRVRIPKPEHDSFHRAGRSPAGMAALLVVLLVLISYHSCFKSLWFRPLWHYH